MLIYALGLIKMKLHTMQAIIALQSQDELVLANCIFSYFKIPPLAFQVINKKATVPRAGVLVVPETFTSYAFGELKGIKNEGWGFSTWSFNVRDPHNKPYFLFM